MVLFCKAKKHTCQKKWIENTLILTNYARKECGGGIYADECNIEIHNNVKIISNGGQCGGGLYAINNSTLNISNDVTFLKNKYLYTAGGSSTRRGGAILCEFCLNVTIQNNVIVKGNTNGIYLYKVANVTIANNILFDGNIDGAIIVDRSQNV